MTTAGIEKEIAKEELKEVLKEEKKEVQKEVQAKVLAPEAILTKAKEWTDVLGSMASKCLFVWIVVFYVTATALTDAGATIDTFKTAMWVFGIVSAVYMAVQKAEDVARILTAPRTAEVADRLREK